MAKSTIQIHLQVAAGVLPDLLPAPAELLTPLYTVITKNLNLRRADKPWKIAIPASGTTLYLAPC